MNGNFTLLKKSVEFHHNSTGIPVIFNEALNSTEISLEFQGAANLTVINFIETSML